MHDVNPLGLTMYLRELDRQATPKLRPLRPGGKGVPMFMIDRVRRVHALWRAAKGSQTIANWFAYQGGPTNFTKTAVPKSMSATHRPQG
jgi:hypothetical protein